MPTVGDLNPSTGILPAKVQPGYTTYKSPYGPKYKIQPNVRGITALKLTRFGLALSGFGAAAGIFAVFFFSDIPRFRRDVIQKIPIIGPHFIKEIPASDNPF